MIFDFYFLYWISGIILIPGMILAIFAQLKVSSAYKKYSKIGSKSGWIAREMSEMLLERAGAGGVRVYKTGGSLTDYYNPKDKTLHLSETVHDSSSIAALAVSAHEVGHAIQDNEHYAPLKFRKVIVPIVNLGSRLAIPLAIIGLILTFFEGFGEFGEFMLFIGIIAYSLTFVFALITLPVEINASNRAKKLLLQTNVLDEKEIRGASKVLSAAAWTYVASMIISLLYLLRFILVISSLRRRD